MVTQQIGMLKYITPVNGTRMPSFRPVLSSEHNKQLYCWCPLVKYSICGGSWMEGWGVWVGRGAVHDSSSISPSFHWSYFLLRQTLNLVLWQETRAISCSAGFLSFWAMQSSNTNIGVTFSFRSYHSISNHTMSDTKSLMVLAKGGGRPHVTASQACSGAPGRHPSWSGANLNLTYHQYSCWWCISPVMVIWLCWCWWWMMVELIGRWHFLRLLCVEWSEAKGGLSHSLLQSGAQCPS